MGNVAAKRFEQCVQVEVSAVCARAGETTAKRTVCLRFCTNLLAQHACRYRLCNAPKELLKANDTPFGVGDVQRTGGDNCSLVTSHQRGGTTSKQDRKQLRLSNIKSSAELASFILQVRSEVDFSFGRFNDLQIAK